MNLPIKIDVMVRLEAKYILGVDFDNTTVKTDEALRQYSEAFYPGQYPQCHFEPLLKGEAFPPGFEKLRIDFLTRSDQIDNLVLYPMIGASLRLAGRSVDEILLITARKEGLRHPLKMYLKHNNLLPHFSAMSLRPETESGRTSKLNNIIDAGVTDMVDDDRELAELLAGQWGVRVALVDRPWNRQVADSLNIIRFGEFIDFAVALAQHKTPEALFAYNYKVRIGGQERVMEPWRVTPQQTVYALSTMGRPREAEAARHKFIADTTQKPHLHFYTGYQLQS